MKKKSVEGLPFPMIATGTLLSFLWLLYGIILNNGVMVIQNVIALILSGIQLSLFAIYPTKPAKQGKSKTTDKKKSKKTN